MAGSDLLSIGTSALVAFQQALGTTGNNISNVNTPGYSRERVDMVPQPAQSSTIGSIGNGVRVSSIQRLYDELIGARLNDATASQNQATTFQGLASQLDNLLGSSSSDLASGMQNFFNAVQDVANQPSSSSDRQTLLSQAQSLVSLFQFYSSRLSGMQSDINTRLSGTVTDINALAQKIADLNVQIASSQDNSTGGPLSLLDQRDQLIQQLSQDVGVKTVKQDNGAVNVFIGSGQPLVVGGQAQELAVTPNQYDPTQMEIGYKSGGSSTQISAQLSGGTIGGLLQARNEIVDPAQNELGRIAIGLAADFNTQHKLGVDLNGNPGGDFFNEPAPQVLADTNNTGSATVTASIDNTGNLTTSDYRLSYNGGNNYTLTRLSDNQTFTINTGGSYPYTTNVIDGISLKITGGAALNDSFLIQPTVNGAQAISVAISNPALVAAAAPITAQAATANTGTGTITPGSVNSPNDTLAITFNSPATSFNVVDQTTGATLAANMAYTSGGTIAFNGVSFQISDGGTPPAPGDQFTVTGGVTAAAPGNAGGGQISAATVDPPDPHLADPVTITFNNPPTSFNVSGATTGTPTTNVPYTSGTPISFNGWTVSISGTPGAGDTFTVGPNSGGVGDNRNALQLANLQTAKVLDGGAATLQGAYGQLVSDVGIKTQQAGLAVQAQTALVNQATQDQQSVSGVNLDEEAANLVKFQQAYQAAAHLISVSNTLFQSLLGAFR